MAQTEIDVAISNGWQYKSGRVRVTFAKLVRLSDAPDFLRATNDDFEVVAYFDKPEEQSKPRGIVLPIDSVAAAKQPRYVKYKSGV